MNGTRPLSLERIPACLLDITLAFWHTTVHTMHSLSIFLCVPFILTGSKVQFGVAHDGFKKPLFFIEATLTTKVLFE